MKIYQVRILTEDFGRSFRFYRDTLGLPVVWGDETGNYVGFAVEGEAQIAIFRRDGMREAVPGLPASTSNGSPVIVLEVTSVDDLYDRLSRKGVAFETAPRDYPGWTIRAVHLRDPDGTLIEFFEPLAREKWTEDARAKEAQARAVRG